MTHRNSYAQKLLKTAVFTRTRANFHAQNAFTHRERFYTQRTLLHTDACTRCRFHTGTHTHTRAKTFTNKCLSATHRCFDTNGFSQKACRHRCFVRQAHLDPHGCFYTQENTETCFYIGRFLYTCACSEQRFKFGCWTVSRKKNQFRRGGGRGIKREELRSFHRKQIDKSPPSSVHCVEA